MRHHKKESSVSFAEHQWVSLVIQLCFEFGEFVPCKLITFLWEGCRKAEIIIIIFVKETENPIQIILFYEFPILVLLKTCRGVYAKAIAAAILVSTDVKILIPQFKLRS